VASKEADGPITEFEEDAYEFLTGVNLKGPMYACKHAIPAMLDTGDGTGVVVNNASIVALIAEPGMDIYTATKGALVSLTRSVAVEYAPEIRANTICPGIVETPMHHRAAEQKPDRVTRFEVSEPMPGKGQPEHLADAVLHLGSDLAARITGVTLPVDGGFLIKP
jgi:NAD(P)-dependent dehydrogenase (short-subunit alcohol dehydrogenase family)